ncbi:MAG TPA: NAD(P)-dependent alcohol dehydrogenase [Chondromyces sp.]|nr:NAD(P)-dependent alcohol dehydrogenase [Chondromyces sp.]
MAKVPAYAALTSTAPLAPFTIERREPGAKDVEIDILFCGICHSDVHQVRDEWGGSIFPMVPGHEIVGRVRRVGPSVERFAVGDLVGVGCMVDSCRTCDACARDLEQFCHKGCALTYNGTEMDRKTPTFGGYSTAVVVDEAFVLRVPESLDPAGAAPLLCAGITTFSPLKQWGCKPGDRVGVVGLGGLGHMAVKLASSMGAEVTMLSTSKSKQEDAERLGASKFALTSDEATFERLAGHFDLIINTISAPHDYNKYLGMVRTEGTMVLLGVPPEPTPVSAFALLMGNKKLAGSLIGGIAETQEMLDYCGEHGIVSDVEVIRADQVNEAYERMLKGDVRYRFVIDAASLKGA